MNYVNLIMLILSLSCSRFILILGLEKIFGLKNLDITRLTDELTC